MILKEENILIKQAGFLTITALVLLVTITALLGAFFYMFVGNSRSSTDLLTSAQALYAAESGLETGIQSLSSYGLSCIQLSNYANVPLGTGIPGSYTLQGVLAISTSPAALSTAISSAATVIPLTSIAPYNANGGRVLIDAEAINYTAVSTNTAVCGVAPCLTNVTRGAGNSAAAAHSGGTVVSQNDCVIYSTGTVPTTALNSQRSVFTSFQNQDGWITGQTDSSGEMILRWNGGFSRISPSSAVPNAALYDIKMLSYTNGWIVGAASSVSGRNQTLPTILSWNGSAWSRVLPNVSGNLNSDLYAIDCDASNDCWAVGKAVNSNLLFLRWNGSTWTQYTQSGLSINSDLYGINCAAANNCWAVGEAAGGNLLLLNWNGTKWNQFTVSGAKVNQNLQDVFCTSSSNCWAVGQGSSNSSPFVFWNGSQWSQVNGDASIPRGAGFNAINCVSAVDCWAVGNHSGNTVLLAHYNGSTWSLIPPDNSVPNSHNLFDVDCLSSNDCWAVGQQAGNSVLVIHWNGSVWSLINTGITSNSDLQAINLLGAAGGNNAVSNWQEDFH